MATSVKNPTTKRYAVVTGANKGLGLGICKQVAADHGITVILTARDEQRGLEAVKKLKESAGLSDDQIIFHQLDVADPSSVSSLADFIKTKFGRLDILVNNAGIIGGAAIDEKGFLAQASKTDKVAGIKWDEISTESYELTEQCVQTNYYGAKRMTEALIPLLQLSDSPRIANVSSSMGKLKPVKYIVSKAAMNAYTRILAKKYPTFCINAACPGYVKTDINMNTGQISVEDGAKSVVKLVLLPDGGPSGLFFVEGNISSFE